MTDPGPSPTCPVAAELRRRQAAPVERMKPEECPDEWQVGGDAE